MLFPFVYWRRTLRVHLLTALAFSLVLSLTAFAAEGADRPNIVFILADDMGWADIGYHNAEIRTPNLDRLAREGVELDCHYVQPQCTPTRVALMTGRYPSRIGPHCLQANTVHAYPFETLTMAKMLASVGYDTALIGKWHMGSKPVWGPNHHGFAYSYGNLSGALGVYDHRYRLNSPYAQTWHRNGQFIEEEGHLTDLIARDAIAWLKRPRQNQPFFLYLPFTAVHTPLVEEQKWLDANSHIADPDRRLFAAAATHMDDAIGQVMDTLTAIGQRDNTLVVFCADNGGIAGAYKGNQYPAPDPSLKAGFSQNTPLRGGKGECFEGGMRVPALAYWPGKLEPRMNAVPMHVIDWMPTFAHLVDYRTKDNPKFDGKNIWTHLLADPTTPQSREFYFVWHQNRNWEGLRYGAWKIVRNKKKNAAEPGPWMLFDLAADPSESTDRAADRSDLVADLSSRFAAQLAKDNLTPSAPSLSD